MAPHQPAVTKRTRKPFRMGLAQVVCRRLPPLVSSRVREWIYPRGLSEHDDYEFVARSVTGGSLVGVTRDLFTYAFGVQGYYEWRLLAIAVALCAPDDTILEVGANVGTETVGFADIVPKGRVFAFEPLDALRSRLEKLVSLNAYRNLTLVRYGLGNECKRVEFTVPPSENSGLGYVVADGAPDDGSERVQVEIRTLDSMAAELGPARIIFADIEGSEHAMIQGGRAYISAHRPALVLEAHHQNAARLGTTLRAVHDDLVALGYQVLALTRFSVGPVDVDSKELETWLCIHESRREDLTRVKAAFLRCGMLPVVHGLNPLALS